MVKYLMLWNAKGVPIMYYELETGDYAEIAGNLECTPDDYEYHGLVSREEVEKHFEMDDEDD